MRHKDQVLPPDRCHGPSEAGEIVVDSPRRPGDALRLVTLSWSVPQRGGDLLDQVYFLSTLEQLRENHTEPWDMLLSSGRTLSSEPQPQQIHAKTSGFPALFEVINETGQSARWLLNHGVTKPLTTLIRAEQLVFRCGDETACYDRLSSVLMAGDGVIRLFGRETRLVLFICGENNSLNTEGRNRSTLYRPGSALADGLAGRWVALNPAHNPYWPQSKMTGFAKVGRVGGVGETMARTVARRTPYLDGTTPPLAFVHANSFFADRPRTRDYASVAFGPTGRLAPQSMADGEIPAARGGEPLRWLAASYRIPDKDDDRVADRR